MNEKRRFEKSLDRIGKSFAKGYPLNREQLLSEETLHGIDDIKRMNNTKKKRKKNSKKPNINQSDIRNKSSENRRGLKNISPSRSKLSLSGRSGEFASR